MLANMYEQQPDAPKNVETYMVLGEQYEKGENIKQDYRKAFDFYKKAKLLGHEPANESIARIIKILPELK
jgi:TPR repeat protein